MQKKSPENLEDIKNSVRRLPYFLMLCFSFRMRRTLSSMQSRGEPFSTLISEYILFNINKS